MAFETGICPKCREYILVKDSIPFLVCPMCGNSISNREATTTLNQKCADIDNVNDLIADCIALEIQYGPEMPIMILAKLADNFPQMESPAYLLTKLARYSVAAVHMYLKSFAEIKSDPKNVPWAEEFLDNCISYSNMEFADLFIQYIQNKVRKEKKQEYIDKVEKLRKEYTFKAKDPNSTKLLMALYIAASILNVLLFPVFMLISGSFSASGLLYFLINITIAIVVITIEITLMFWHQKVYGNRLSMSDKERIWMVIFISSFIFAIGASVMGSVWRIVL